MSISFISLNFSRSLLKDAGKDAKINSYVEEIGGFFHDIINIMSSKAFLLYPKAAPLIPAVSFAFLQSPPVHKNARRRRHHHV